MPSEDMALEDASLSIALEKTASHGYADLSVRAAIDGGAGEKSKAPPSRVERRVLRYDGNQYQLGTEAPWWMQF